MKIAIAAADKTIDSLVDPRFGRCKYFLIVDSKTDEVEVIENIGVQASQGAGITAAQLVADKKVGAVMAGNFGPKAVMVLGNSGIKLFGGVSGISVKKAVAKFKTGELTEL